MLEVLKVRAGAGGAVLMVLMVLGAGGAGGATQVPAAGEQRTITGQVVDAATGRPVSAATVSLILATIEGLQ